MIFEGATVMDKGTITVKKILLKYMHPHLVHTLLIVSCVKQVCAIINGNNLKSNTFLPCNKM